MNEHIYEYLEFARIRARGGGRAGTGDNWKTERIETNKQGNEMTAFNWNDYLSDSKTLRKDMLTEQGEDLTVKGFRSQDFDDGPRLFMSFHERKEELGLNKTNLKWLQFKYPMGAEAAIGHRLNVYVDPLVEYQGKAVGGLKIRDPQFGNGQQAPPPPTSLPQGTPQLPPARSAAVPQNSPEATRLAALINEAQTPEELTAIKNECVGAFAGANISQTEAQLLNEKIQERQQAFELFS